MLNCCGVPFPGIRRHLAYNIPTPYTPFISLPAKNEITGEL